MERAPEVCSIAEAKRQCDILVGQRRVAEIFQGNLGPELVAQAAKGKALLTKLASQCLKRASLPKVTDLCSRSLQNIAGSQSNPRHIGGLVLAAEQQRARRKERLLRKESSFVQDHCRH